MTDRLLQFLIRIPSPLIIVLDLMLTALSFVIALSIRFDFYTDSFAHLRFFLFPLPCLLIVRYFAYSRCRVYDVMWRYVSMEGVLRIGRAHVLSTICFTALLGLSPIEGFPRSIPFIEFAVSLGLILGVRVLARVGCERFAPPRPSSTVEKEVVVIGAGVSGQLLVKALVAQRRFGYKPVAVLDDCERLHGLLLHGIPVVGALDQLGLLLQTHPRVGAVIVAIPILGQEKLHQIREACSGFNIPMKQIQTFEELACRDGIEPKTARSVEELLNREVEITKEREIEQQIKGKCVLATGAGGSIGSELVRQITSFGPSKLILLDSSEFNLFSIEQELCGRTNAPFEKVFALASITDKDRLDRIFREHRPQMVFHAAAYKHVPLLEVNCTAAFVNNVIGTKNLLETSLRYSVEKFVLISTDKAVDPSSVMGCTKRVAELMVAKAAQMPSIHPVQPSGRAMHTAVVRFGNVINSAGSVIPLFKKQILEGKPLTVTHPEMERYFMSIRQAVRLVLTAGTLGDQGEVYLLDMGKPIKIVDVAKKLLTLYGRRDLPIVFTGLREGEKLTEQLRSESEYQTESKFEKIYTVRPTTEIREDVFGWVEELHRKLESLPEREVGRLLHEFILTLNGKQADTRRVSGL
jgi:FlaA1/EpsC-like NDP-sugar epimerase